MIAVSVKLDAQLINYQLDVYECVDLKFLRAKTTDGRLCKYIGFYLIYIYIHIYTVVIVSLVSKYIFTYYSQLNQVQEALILSQPECTS